MASRTGINKVIGTVMSRNGMEYNKAKKLVEDTKDQIDYLLDFGARYSEIEDLVKVNLGLESNYIIYLV